MALNGKTIGLALSGGGYRATLFGLGSLWRLNEAGLLGKLDRITGVSGGSILLGVLAHRWRDLQFEDGRAVNFAAEIADPIRAFCGQTIDVGVTLLGALTPFKTAGDYLAERYAKALFGDTRLKDLPDAASGCPHFIFYATNLQTGRSFRFRQDRIADYFLGISNVTDHIPLAFAVAASSAFPPVFSPILLKTDPTTWRDGETLPNLNALREVIVLADGGIYDNMGLEAFFPHTDKPRSTDIVLVSDAGAPCEIEEEPAQDNIRQMGRIRDILIDQTRALRKRWLIAEFEAGRQQGAYWGISTKMKAYGPTPRMIEDSETSDALEHVPTRLKRFEDREQGHLINWGYSLCDVSLRARVGLSTPMATTWPIPEWPL